MVLATGNAGKVLEFQKLLSPLGYRILSLKEAGIISNPIEDGNSYRENCYIKALDAAKKTNFPVLADDSGLEIESFGNRPGIHTARFAKENGGFPAVFQKIFDELSGKENRRATFHCCLCYLSGSEETPLFFEGACPGFILFEPRGDHGFGYDPIFHSEEADADFGTADEETKNEYSHRGKASRKLKEYLLTK